MTETACCTGDLWILTRNQAIYQSCPHQELALKAVENDWLLL